MNDDQLETRAALLDEVRALLVQHLRVKREPQQIDPDVSLFGTGLGLDSVDAVELVVALESALGIQVPDGPEAKVALRTPNSLVDLLLSQRRAAS